ncbi:MAG: TIGR01459 family HAD-type hydrolase [Pseudomonadota bacterium]
MTRDIRGLAEIRAAFDTVLIDQFGVLHDGRTAFPGAADCLQGLAASGVPMAALSNSGKRSHLNTARLARLGFPASLFQAVITSGELAHARLAERLADGRLPKGAPVAVISRDDDTSMIAGLSLRSVALRDTPSLLIIAAAEPEKRTLDSYVDEMAPLARAGVPALCINPDRWIYANGIAAFGPGKLAERYRDLGGRVEMLGKPGREMFEAGLKALDARPERCLMIGDSPEHDIAGAKAAGCQTLLISTGVQSGTAPEGVAQHEMVPDYRMESLVG